MNSTYLDIYFRGCIAGGYSKDALQDRFAEFSLHRNFDSIDCDLINCDEHFIPDPKVSLCNCYAIYKKRKEPNEEPILILLSGLLKDDIGGLCRMRIHKTQFKALGIDNMSLEELVAKVKDPQKRIKLHSLFYSLGEYGAEIQHILEIKK